MTTHSLSITYQNKTDVKKKMRFSRCPQFSVTIKNLLIFWLNQIYLDMTSEGPSHLSSQLSGKLESISSKLYRNMIRQAKDAGIVDAEIDTALAAFSLDNLILTLQFSYTSAYYKERMEVFLGPDLAEDEDAVTQGIMRFIRGALQLPVGK